MSHSVTFFSGLISGFTSRAARPLLVLAACLIAACGAADVTLAASPDTAHIVPEKSPNDDREYRVVILENELKVVLISDPETEKAAASLDVDSGSNSNPPEFEGLAHFLEHMLFLGTEKYPESGEYQAYIAAHGGSHNAYTGFENTNYYFDIEKDYLEPALDRFSQFFIAPLFNQEYVDRERNAVHSEYQANLQNDGRRANSAYKEIINPEHPLSMFSVGSLGTLQSREDMSLREALLRHYEENYSANLMSVAILGSESLDELEAMARQYFAPIPNRNVPAPGTEEDLFREDQLPAMLEYKPFRDVRGLSFTFPIPVIRPFYESRPASYIGNLIGHEGEGSLLSLLKARGWANTLSAGAGFSTDDNATFAVNISLTEEGINRLDEITSLLFQYIDLVKQDGVQDWLFEEQRQMAELAFLFQTPSPPISYVSSLSRRLQEYPPEEILTAPYTYEEFDPGLIRDILGHLTPDNVLLTFTSPTVEAEQTEPWFGGEYSYDALAPERVSRWSTDSTEPALALPESNPFLPEDLTIKGDEEFALEAMQVADVVEPPKLVLDEEGVRLWFEHDDIFNIPRANFYAYAMTPLFSESVENSLLSDLVVSLINDKLNEYTYPASLAGVYYGVSSRSRGFLIQLGGYNDRQQTLLTEVLETIVQTDFDPGRFEIIKAELARRLANADRQTPYVRVYQKLQSLITNPYWSEEERLAALAEITLEDVTAFVPRMLENLRIDALYHGNVTEAEALAMMDIITSYLDTSREAPIPDFGTVVKLPEDTRIVQSVPVEHEDSAIVIYMQGPDDSLETQARVSLLGTILRSPFFDTLRTEQQLGYIVRAGSMSVLDVSGLVMYIESPSADPVALERNIDEFLLAYEEELLNMDPAMFGTIKAGLLTNLRQKPQTLNNLSSRFWSGIMNQESGQDSVLELAAAIAPLGKEDIAQYYQRHVSNPDAGRLVARSFGNAWQDAMLESRQTLPEETILIITPEDFNAFKESSEVYIYQPSTPPTE